MRIYKLFTFALAAMAFAACSDNDATDNQGPNTPDNWEADLEGITINFASKIDPSTRAYDGETESEGTEAVIYDAYVFAREANPSHERPLDGDWTVLKCEVNGKGEVVGKGEPVANPDGTITLKNVATFHGVRQGDYVYVIANDPNMNMAKATTLAHNGQQSEETIKSYTSMLSKEYLGRLTYGLKPDKSDVKPKAAFIMAGMAQIPVAPTVPSNGTLEIEVGLDRELSKVNFKALVTTTPSDLAYQKVEFRQGDGIVVARIAPTTSMFKEREANFYVPSPTCVENWPINDHSIFETGSIKYKNFCDQTIEGSRMFDGLKKWTNPEPWNEVELPDSFNIANPTGDIEEYRYSWVFRNPVSANAYEGPLSGDHTTMIAPMFYTTPNYSKNTNGVTVICTQATYTGEDELMYKEFTKIKETTLTSTSPDIEFRAGAGTVVIPNPLYVYENDTTMAKNGNDAGKVTEAKTKNLETTQKYLASLKTVIGKLGMKYFRIPTPDAIVDESVLKGDFANFQLNRGWLETDKVSCGVTKATDGSLTVAADAALSLDIYDEMMNRFYEALVLQYRAARNDAAVQGTLLTELGNKIPADTLAYFAEPARNGNELMPTDYLLLGTENTDYKLWVKKPTTRATDYSQYTQTGEVKKDTPIFYIFQDRTATLQKDWKWKANTTDFSKGKAARLAYFASTDAFKYFTFMKLYYRADIANYVGNASNRMTERNMYYQTVGTIQSLGARTIHEAIYSESNTMQVDVKVNKWRLSINKVPM